MPFSSVSVVSASSTPCGVESFARLLAAQLGERQPGRHETFNLTGQPGEIDVLRRVLSDHDTLIVNLPVVAWKRLIFQPLKAMRAARRLDRDVVLVLHEWADLDWKRRATYRLYLPYATRILFSSPSVRAQFASDVTTRIATRDLGLVPIPPNIERPAIVPSTPLAEMLTARKREGKLLLGHFGSIYPKKQSLQVLDIAAALKAEGQPVHAAFIGSFIGGGTVDPKTAFDERVRARGLEGDVTVSGYIGPTSDVFAALEACDVFVYLFAEGQTSRRGSVLACLTTSRPVLVNAPSDLNEFSHHPSFARAIADGRLALLPLNATPKDCARWIIQHRSWRPGGAPVSFERAWGDAVTAVLPDD